MSLSEVKHVHFIGIGGYGMSALAQLMLKLGCRVSGSDLQESAITARLAEQGAAVSLGHSRKNIDNCDLVVYSTAISDDNPELLEARGKSIPVWHRSELLAVLLNEHYGIAVAGTHGKTTTTAMIALLLERGGLDPTAVVGGILDSFGGNARAGKSAYLVAEACESDNSFLRYYPSMAVITNLEPDHLEHYDGDFSRLIKSYEVFLHNLKADGTAIICVDDPNLQKMAPGLDRKVITYGIRDECGLPDYAARHIKLEGFGARFVLYHKGIACSDEIRLCVPGEHNIVNSVGALAAAKELGLDLRQCAAALESFQGAGRRFQILGEANGIVVIDDYAHHPTEVLVTIKAALASGRRVCSIFQPHRYTRTAFFFDEFTRAFDGSAAVLLHKVYPAGEKIIPGATSEELARRISAHKGGPVYAYDSMEDLENKALVLLRPGDLLLVMGAGDISRAAYSILNRLEEIEGQ